MKTDKFILLTEGGERCLYGKFDIGDGMKEFMSIFKEINIRENEILSIQSFYAKKDQVISPLNIKGKNLKVIIDNAIENNYIEEKQNSFLLTDKGRRFIDTI